MTRATAVPETVTIHVPFRIVKRGGRKEMQVPTDTRAHHPDDALIKALARAFRWKRMLESGEFATITELAAREAIPSTYMARVLRLTLLAPELIEAILDGRQPRTLTLPTVMKPFPMAWMEQRTFR
jgi:DNA primase large subunit